MNLFKKYVVFGILFWVLYFLYEWLGNAAVTCEYDRYLVNAAVIVPITLAATLTVQLLIKRYFLKKKRALFWLGLIASVIVFTIIRRTFNYYYTYPHYYPQGSSLSFFFFPKLLIEAVNIYLITALYTMFYFIQAWHEQQQKTQALQKDKVEVQLELLKSQVQPHFIFNTLNNIYSLSQRGNTRAAELIYRLSALLSYMLYDSKKNVISLKKEIEYVNNYIELEKIRYGERLDVSVNVFSNVDHFYISPLLLLPLVENSFKHGVNENIGDCWIRIDVSVHDQWLSAKIENSYNGLNPKTEDYRNGIGLENVRKRLEILYPSQHEFRCMTESHSFLSVLKIKNLSNESPVPDY